MEEGYVDVMKTSELAYVALVYVLHGAMALMQASLVCLLLFSAARDLIARPAARAWPQAFGAVALAALLVAPWGLGAPMLISAGATLGVLGLALYRMRAEPDAESRMEGLTRAAAIAFSLCTLLFMLWEREDNIALTMDLLTHTLEFRSEEIAWQQEHDPRSPKIGDLAPDFELQDPRGNAQIRLSDFRGKRPVALVFGSYT